jgi:hypothetical protein
VIEIGCRPPHRPTSPLPPAFLVMSGDWVGFSTFDSDTDYRISFDTTRHAFSASSSWQKDDSTSYGRAMMMMMMRMMMMMMMMMMMIKMMVKRDGAAGDGDD